MTARAQRLFGLAGWSGSGKTTLMTRLIPALGGRGIGVSTVKHAHHSFDVDLPGKDSYEHRRAGAVEVMVSSASRWALMHENRSADEPSLDALLARMAPVDLILVEGFKRLPIPKLEIFRPSVGKKPLYEGDDHIVAVASDAALPGLALPVLALDDVDGIARFIIRHCGLGEVARGVA